MPALPSIKGLTTHKWLGAGLRLLYSLLAALGLALIAINLTYGHILEKDVLLRVGVSFGLLIVVGLFGWLAQHLPTMQDQYGQKDLVRRVLAASLLAGAILSYCAARPLEADNVAGPKRQVESVGASVYSMGVLLLFVNFALLVWNYWRYGSPIIGSSAV